MLKVTRTNRIQTLRRIGRVLSADKLDYDVLASCIRTYRALLNEIAVIDPEDEKYRRDMQFTNGKAIGTTWAASCVEDVIRTRAFVKGLGEAVECVRRNKPSPVRILYAGTGPYAALVLPLLSQCATDDVRVTLVEVNPLSLTAVRTIIETLELNKYITGFTEADATKLHLADGDYDILLCETMQAGLGNEQQVPILLNLLPQMADDVVLIPQSIDLSLAFLNTSDPAQPRYDKIGTVFSLTKSHMRTLLNEQPERPLRFTAHHLPLPAKRPEHADQLVLLTDILVYGNNRIGFNESGLTVPRILCDLLKPPHPNLTVVTQYVIDQDPGIRYEVLQS